MKIPTRYKSKNKLFDGGMSNAALYRDEHLERDVVIKTLQSGADQKRLIDEVRALSSIRSKHVVEIYDVIRNDTGNIEAIIEEYVPGDDLNSLAGKVDANHALRIIYAVARGLSDIHEHGQIHRDMKPPNMKFDGEGCLKIFDFGLSREDADAATNGLIGTFGYMAPELCVSDGEEAKFTQAIDTFAFASVALKLVRGSLPKQLREVPPQLPCPDADFFAQAVKLPDEVCDALNRCHAKQAQDRPAMEEVMNILAKYLLFDQHRASLVIGGSVHALHAGNRVANISAGTMGKFTITYDGLQFSITTTTGSIFVNNIPVTPPSVLPGSCVITMGPQSAGMSRVYVPVDVSHPEVTA